MITTDNTETLKNAMDEIERLNAQVARCKEFIESTLICWSEDYAEVLRIWSDRK